MSSNIELDKDSMNLSEMAESIRKNYGFDSVVIIAVKHDDSDRSTAMINANAGNIYSSNWAVEEYLIRQRAFCTPRDD